MQRYKENMVFFHFYAYLTLTLTKFKLRVLLVNHEKTTFTTHDLAIVITLLD